MVKVDKFIEAYKQAWEATTCRQLTDLNVKTLKGIQEYLKNVHDYTCTA